VASLRASAGVRDRAFSASVLALGRSGVDRESAAAEYAEIRAAAAAEHAELRRGLLRGAFGPAAFVAHLLEAPLELRDQLVEEILDIAYPSLAVHERAYGPAGHSPSALAEVLFMLEQARLGPESTFVDLGSGLGKVVLLAALLTGARAYGIELDAELVLHARSAAASLGLERAEFIAADLRHATIPAADAYYMFIPSARSADVVERLEPLARQRKFVLFSQCLDLARFPWLASRHAGSYWLETYETR
jgi:SAM-dependent methyltransferase